MAEREKTSKTETPTRPVEAAKEEVKPTIPVKEAEVAEPTTIVTEPLPTRPGTEAPVAQEPVTTRPGGEPVVAPKPPKQAPITTPRVETPLPTRPDSGITPRPSLTNATAVDAAFQTILDNLPRATFDHATNRMLLDVINDVTRCRAKTSNFFKRI